MNIDFTGWTKEVGLIRLDGYEDVHVTMADADREPFAGQVGDFMETFDRLEDAMIYARTLAEERAILVEPGPLPGFTAEAEEVEYQDRQFLDARGLVAR